MKPADKQWKAKMQKTYEKGIKQISMIDMASKRTGKHVNKQGKQVKKQRKEDKQAKRQTKGGVHGGQM